MRVRSPSCAFALLALLFVFVAPPLPARAHTFTTPKRDSVRVEPDGVTLAIDYLVPPAEAVSLRRLWDFDRDGRIDGKERDAAVAWLVLAASHFASIEIDGHRVALAERIADRHIEGLDEPASSSAVIRVSLVLAAGQTLRAGTHRLALSDRHKDGSIEVPATIALVGGLEAAPGAALGGSLGGGRAALAVDFRAP